MRRFFRRIKSNKGSSVGSATDTYVIVGLGNPGPEYAMTRHNMGYRAIDIFAEGECIEIRKSKFHSIIGQGRLAGKKLVLVKPETYMNKSGIAVREAAMYFDVPSENVIVIYDDVDLPLGSIRIRKAGGAGTHNGMKSVVEQLGTKDFVRIRIGVGSAEKNENLIDRVIGKVPKEEQVTLDKAAADAADAVRDIIKLGTDVAMNRHNRVAGQAASEKTTDD